MNRDGSLSSFPASLDNFQIKWPIGEDRINGQTASTRNDQERASHWNHMFDAALNLEKYLQKIISSNGIVTYSTTGSVLQGENLVLGYEQFTLPASGSQTSWEYTLTVPSAFGANPFLDRRFNISPTVFINIVSGNYLKPAAGGVGAFSDYDYRGELLTTYQPYSMITPVSGSTFKLKIETLKQLPSSQLIGELEENCSRPTTTEQLGGNWIRYGDYPALGIGNNTFSAGGAGTLLYMCSEGVYADNNSQFWDDNWGIGYPASLGTSNDQQVIFSPYTWKGDGVDVGDYMSRSIIGLRVSGDFGYTGGNLKMYAIVIGDEPMPSTTRPTIGRLIKINNSYMFGWNYWDTYNLVASDPLTNITSLGTFPLKLVADDNLPNLRYKFSVSGNVLTVQEATDGSSYSTVLTTTDSTITQGTVGIFSTALRGISSGEKCRRLMFYNYLKFQVLSSESPCDLKLNLLYSLVGTDNPQLQSL